MLSPSIYNFLGNLGYTGTTNDRLYKYLRDSTGRTGSIDDLLYYYLGTQNFTGTLSDRITAAQTASPTLPTKTFDFTASSLPPGLTYTNSSTARAWWDSTGTRQTAVANEPIFETLGGVLQGMRWEMEARTNLATNSEGAAVTWSTTQVSDALTPISGFAASLQFGDNSVSRSAYKTISVTSSTVYTVSVYVQMDDNSVPVVGANSSTGDFCLVANAAVIASAATVTKIASNLYRVSATRTATSTSTSNHGVVKYSTQSTKAFRITGIQVEAAASASSYIQTAGASVTRQPDVLTASSISPWYNQSEGTIVFEGINSRPSTDTATSGMWLFSDGTDANRIVGRRLSGNTADTAIVTATVLQGNPASSNTLTTGATYRTAHFYKVNDFGLSLNGGAIAVDVGGTIPAVNSLKFGQGNTAGTQAFMGYARRFSYYNTRLPNAIVQGLSRV